MLLLSLVFIAVALSSCHDDEPAYIGYFISVSSRDFSNEKTVEVIRAMQDSIQAAYPKPNANGNDNAVIRACSNAYRYYRDEHPEYFDGGRTAYLYRGPVKGTVFLTSSVIATWRL